MTPVSRRNHTTTFSLAPVMIVLTMMIPRTDATEADKVFKCIDDIKAGPSIYYTPEAAAYYATRGNYSVSGLSVNRDAAVRSFRAVTTLAGMSLGQVRDAIPALVDYFPKGIHAVLTRNANYSYGYEEKGSLDDCVSTYVMNAKNQVLLSSPFLDYGALQVCENFLESSFETEILSRQVNANGEIRQAIFNLKITFTFYAGECALSRLTGLSLGHDPSAWRQWWATSSGGSRTGYYTGSASSPYAYGFNTYTTPAAAAAANTAPYIVTSPTTIAIPKTPYPDIAVGGKYRVSLATGDEFIGTVESRNDSSMVLETIQGKPYVFKFSIMQSYQVLEPPRTAAPTAYQPPQPVYYGSQITDFEGLKQKAYLNPTIEVKIGNGSEFRGRLLSINDEGLKLDAAGSAISIARGMIVQVAIVPASVIQRNDQPSVPAAAPYNRSTSAAAVSLDTLWVRNSQGGRNSPDQLYTGSIIEEGDNYVTLKLAGNGLPQKFTRDQITRFIRHSAGNTDDPIARYAKPLSCPPDMFLVTMQPNRGNRPFFKVCIDKYEYPNRAGSVPRTNISYNEARTLCAQQGKRLCTADEWQWGCSGTDNLAYPYGKNFDQNRCNSDTRVVEPSGSRKNCISPDGGFDMVGNIIEWVSAGNGKMALMGGPYSKCQTVSEAQNGDAKPQSGLRCCKSN